MTNNLNQKSSDLLSQIHYCKKHYILNAFYQNTAKADSFKKQLEKATAEFYEINPNGFIKSDKKLDEYWAKRFA